MFQTKRPLWQAVAIVALAVASCSPSPVFFDEEALVVDSVVISDDQGAIISRDRFFRDSMGRDTLMIRETQGKTALRHTIFDSEGRVLSELLSTPDADTRTVNTLDSLGRVVAIRSEALVADSVFFLGETTLTLDSLGRTVEIFSIEAHGGRSHTYKTFDSQGEEAEVVTFCRDSETSPWLPSTRQLFSSHQESDGGIKIRNGSLDMWEDGAWRTISSEVNTILPSGRLFTSLQTADDVELRHDYCYDEVGNLTSEQIAIRDSPLGSFSPTEIRQYDYSPRVRRLSVFKSLPSGGMVLASTTVTYFSPKPAAAL